MEFRNYLGYKVYENGDVVNSKGLILKPMVTPTNFCYYMIKGKRFHAAHMVLYAFGFIPPTSSSRIIRKDKNPLNNALNNLSWS
jgi:hypothetical protein